jgi:GDPmannose 4,6-dehydratase
MWLMLQSPEPADYVIGTGKTWSVRDFCSAAFEIAGLDYRDFVTHDTRFDRPAEVDLLVGDSTKAREQLGWQPTVRFPELIQTMVEADLARHARVS